jgi:hypothetical protein
VNPIDRSHWFMLIRMLSKLEVGHNCKVADEVMTRKYMAGIMRGPDGRIAKVMGTIDKYGRIT